MSADDMVMFQMPDGTKVSNDPRFDLDEALSKSLNSRATTGSVGPTWDEQNAQIIAEKQAALNSTQPGVGENATVEDPTAEAHGTLGPPAWRTQKDDHQEALNAGASPKSTVQDDPKPEDSNARVKAVQEAQEKAREAYAKAVDKLGEDGEGDPDVPLEDWSAKQLVAEIAKRNAEDDRAEEDKITVVGTGENGRPTKPDAVKALEADNERIAASTNQE